MGPKKVTEEKAALQKQVNDRAAQQAADDAHARALDSDRQAAADKTAADKRAAAAAKAAAAKKAADDAKRAADAAAAAAAASEAAKNTIDSDGVREVGVEINPGRWKTAGGVGNCYYAILNSSDTFDIADNNNVSGPATVDLGSGQFFETSGCATWTRVG